MEIIQEYATKNRCYQIGTPLKPRGIMLHSVGCAQPSAAVFARSFNQYQPGGPAAASELCPTDSDKLPEAAGTALTKKMLKIEIRSWVV